MSLGELFNYFSISVMAHVSRSFFLQLFIPLDVFAFHFRCETAISKIKNYFIVFHSIKVWVNFVAEKQVQDLVAVTAVIIVLPFLYRPQTFSQRNL